MLCYNEGPREPKESDDLMSMENNKTPNFIEQLTKPINRISQSTLAECSLQYQRSCCQGRGLTIENNGTFAKAKLCSCITDCELCKGQMRRLSDQGIMYSCRTPSPGQICQLINSAMIPLALCFSEVI